MPQKGYKQTEEHKRKIGILNSISLKGHKCSKKQLNALKEGRILSHTKESYIKMVKTRRKRNTYGHSKETIEKIKKGISKYFPNGRPTNSGCFKEGQKAWNKGKEALWLKKEKNVNWKGGKNQWYHKQARKIMEKNIKRKLSSEEIVHHIDGDWKNNKLNNLKIVSSSEHIRIHNPIKFRWGDKNG